MNLLFRKLVISNIVYFFSNHSGLRHRKYTVPHFLNGLYYFWNISPFVGFFNYKPGQLSFLKLGNGLTKLIHVEKKNVSLKNFEVILF